jgi:peptidoglycan hydrolase-like protein with peptidoglycan-binding domain
MPDALAPVPGIEKTSQAFRQKVIDIAQHLGTDPNFLMAVMSFESDATFDSSVRNPQSGATGLIQFMPTTAKDLRTTTDALARMTAEQQLDYVARYFAPHKNRLKTLEDVYMAVLWPKAVGQSNNYVLFGYPTLAYEQNRALDIDKDGKITVAEATSFVRKRLGSAAPASGRSPVSPSNGQASRESADDIRWGQQTPMLRPGSSGASVIDLQNRLTAIGFSPGAADGSFGSLTEAAVKSFQRSRGLNADGIVGPTTWGALLGTEPTAPYPPQTPTSGPHVTIGSRAKVSDNAVRVLKDILRDAGLTHAMITSGRRTSADQARIMYDNLERYGVIKQKNLYGPSGGKVIDFYDAQKRAGKSATVIKQAMENKIKELGCQKVSHHCSDAYDVFDVGPSSIADHSAFLRALHAAKSRGAIDKYLTPQDDDPAFHIEIKLKPTTYELMAEILSSPPLSLDAFVPRRTV